MNATHVFEFDAIDVHSDFSQHGRIEASNGYEALKLARKKYKNCFIRNFIQVDADDKKGYNNKPRMSYKQSDDGMIYVFINNKLVGKFSDEESAREAGYEI